MIKSHTFRGHRWTFGRKSGKGNLGHCDAPHVRRRVMDIPLDGDTSEELRIILHEGLHAALWDLDEEAVHETSSDLARLLWRLGWRKDDEPERFTT